MPSTRRSTVFALTFVVAFCSIVYELIYSELLTVLFGGTVLRYSVTIGLYLFSLGIGAFCSRYLDTDDPQNFFRLEVYLALAGPLGLVFVVAVTSVGSLDALLGPTWTLVVAHLPIVVVGTLSGIEIPLLATLASSGDTERSLPGRVVATMRRCVVGALGLLFATRARGHSSSTDLETAEDGFSEVLGMDYFGSLVGTVVYALYLYPELGLVPAVFVLGLLNALVALVFYWRVLADRSSATPGLASRVTLALCLVTAATYGGAVAAEERVEAELTELYLEDAMESEYATGGMDVEVTEHVTTAYQDVVLYERTWTGDPSKWDGAPTDRCLRLDMHLQLCDSWVDSYHHGLVDVPAAVVGNLSEKDVLLVGGGDWIAANELRKYGASVDHVDIDGEFMNYTRDHPFFEQYHEGAANATTLDTTRGDAFTYLRESDTQYDLVLLDLPGARSKKMLSLYSTEFFTTLEQSLAPDGVVATWSYSRYAFPKHYEAYTTTVREAGFDRYAAYTAYDDLNGDGKQQRAEGFYLLSTGATPSLNVSADRSGYVERHRERYTGLTWRRTPHYDGVEANSIFDPNYDLIVEYDP